MHETPIADIRLCGEEEDSIRETLFEDSVEHS